MDGQGILLLLWKLYFIAIAARLLIDGAKISIGVSIDFIFPKAFSSTIEQNLIQIKIL